MSGSTLALSADQRQWTVEQRAALSQLGVDKAGPGDLAVFLHVAQRTGLDPFSRQLYLIGRWDSQSRCEKFTIQTGIDGFRVIADRHPQYGGQVGPEWCGDDGVWRDVWVSPHPPTAARVGVIRKDWAQPIYAVALFREYAGTVKDKQTGKFVLTRMWREKGALMIAKCSEGLALRKAFPHDLSGIYTSEEMTQADLATGHPEPAPLRTDAEWEELMDRAGAALDADELRELWKQAAAERPGDLNLRGRIAGVAAHVKEQLAAQIVAAAAPLVDEEPVDAELVPDPEPAAVGQKQHAHMHALWGKTGLSRDERLAVTSHLVGRDVGSSSELTGGEADTVIGRLRAFDAAGKAALAEAVERWLGEYAAAAIPTE